jgi:pyruvate dehydrogenase E2 component (dihydrolipoamide acetyltransferase)
MIEFCMPSLGADMEAGTLCEWLVSPGSVVKRGDIIAVVDTQKGLIDIEVFEEGTIHKLLIKENEKVPVGTLMALIIPAKETALKAEKKLPEKIIATQQAPVLQTTAGEMAATDLRTSLKVSPLAKRMAAEKNIDLSSVKGSGEGGAITREDVEKVMVERGVGIPMVKPSTVENIRLAVAAAMSRSNREIPHYYLETRVDMSRPLAFLREANKQRTVRQRLLPVVIMIKSVAKALKEIPDLNGYWENGLKRKSEINIGFVVSLRTGGLMIPAIREADKKTMDELMDSLNDLIPRARAMKLRSSELADSTVTITSLGDENVETVFGVIYPPQVAIIGFGSITEQPWAENGKLDSRPVLRMTLAADHRATDGNTGSRFLMAVKKNLQKPETL